MKPLTNLRGYPIFVTETSAEKRQGFLGQKKVNHGLLLRRCPLVHVFGMSFALDIVFLRTGKIVAIYKGVRPGLRLRGALALDCLELPAGKAEELGLQVGQNLQLA